MYIGVQGINEKEMWQYLEDKYGIISSEGLCRVCKEKGVFRLVQNNDIMDELPAIPTANFVGDIIMYPVLPMDERSLIITDEILEIANLSRNEMLSIALHNSRLQSVYMFVPPLFNPKQAYPMDVVREIRRNYFIGISNMKKTCGANVLLNKKFFDEIYGNIGEFIVLPSSIHEILLLEKRWSGDELKEMLYEINRLYLSKEERLSDKIYYYDGTLKVL